MKDYSDMSDFEINGYISMHEHGFSWIEFDDAMASHVKCGNEGSPGFAIVEVKDYCNNPSDAWPIIDKEMISINRHYDGSYSLVWGYCDGGLFEVKCLAHEIFRSAMIVYLMMKDEEK